MIFANEVGDYLGFVSDYNALTAYWRDGRKEFPNDTKTSLARDLVELVADRFYAARGKSESPRLSIISRSD